MAPSKHFASFGCEKMLYDDRMKPQALFHDGIIYIVYQANEHGKQGHPFLIRYDVERGIWSDPLQLGFSSGVDHHFAPILWMDFDGHFHLLYDCHRHQGTHLISRFPYDAGDWMGGPQISSSITYPRLWRLPNTKTLLLYRVQGHLGYWAYKLSQDGGRNWGEERVIVDFDKDARDERDEWAGTYQGAAPSLDGECLHLGFIYWDERENANPNYKFHRDLYSRYNLYYAKLHLETGALSNIDGEILPVPINRREAEACKIMDSGDELTNFPFVHMDRNDQPCLLAPLSQDSPWTCKFMFYRREENSWKATFITETDNIWAGSYLEEKIDGTLQAYLIAGQGKNESTFYGGGSLERWISQDKGENWKKIASLDPDPGLIYNNPKPIIGSDGKLMPDALTFYGWKGPEGVWNVDDPKPNRGKAFLLLDGDIIGR